MKAFFSSILLISFGLLSFGYADEWDPADDMQSGATILEPPTFLEASHGPHDLSSSDLADWFQLELDAGMTYSIFTTGAEETIGEIYDTEGNLIEGTDLFFDPNPNFYFDITPAESGIYFLKVTSINAQNDIQYTLHYLSRNAAGRENDEWDSADNTPGAATDLGVPSEAFQTHGPHSLSTTDLVDWFSVVLEAGVTYEFRSSGNYRVRGDLFASDGSSRIAAGINGANGLNFKLLYSPMESGVYILRLQLEHPGFNASYSLEYQISDIPLPPGDEWDPTDNIIEGATALMPPTMDAQSHGPHTLSETDLYDWFAIALEADTIYEFSTEDTASTTLDIVAPDRETYLITNDNIFGLNGFSIEFTPTESGMYYLRILRDTVPQTTYTLTYNSKGALPMVEPDAQDPGDNELSGATNLDQPLPIPQTHGPHTLTPADRFDWFRFTVSVGNSYEFWTSGDADVAGTLYDSDGSTVLYIDDDGGAGFNFMVPYTPETSGTVYLQVRLSDPGSNGMYTLNYRSLVLPSEDGDEWDSSDDTPEGATGLDTPTKNPSVHGPHRLSESDTSDWFRVVLLENWIYDISSSGNADVVGEVYDAEASTLFAIDDDSGPAQNFRIQFQPQQSGDFYIRVTESQGSGAIYNLHLRGEELPGIPDVPSTGDKLEPEIVYPLDSADEFTPVPGGFDGAPAGAVEVGSIPQDEAGLSDGQGAAITVAGGEVMLLQFPEFEAGEGVVLIRASVSATGSGVAPALAVVDGSFDGSVATNIPATATGMVDEFGRMILVYDSPNDGTIVPVFQVANSGTDDVTVYLDNVEIYLLPEGEAIPGALFYGE